MFEGKKARKLGLKDIGEVESESTGKKILWGMTYEYQIPTHSVCNSPLRAGRNIKTGEVVRWCPQCEVIITP